MRGLINRIFSYKGGRQLLLFVFCLFLASSVWTVHKMSGEFSHVFQYKIQANTNIAGRKSASLSENEITLRAKASGFYILQQRYSLKKGVLNLEINSRLFSKLPEEDMLYLMTSDIRENITEGLSEKISVEYVATDTLKFLFPVETSKVVPISLRRKVAYRDQYMPVGEIRLKPDKIMLHGESSLLDKVDSVVTKPIYLNNINAPVTDIVALERIPGLRYSDDEVYYTINVERYIEERINLPVSVINIPDSVSVLTSSSEVTITCRVSFKNAKSFRGGESIELVSDYQDMVGTNSSMIRVKAVGEMGSILEYRIEPPFLEVIVIGKKD